MGLRQEPLWGALGDDEFALRRCLDCRAWLDPVPPRCEHCAGSTVLEPVSGTGVVESFIVMRQPPMRAFAGRRPYALALVTLDEGIRLPGRLEGIRPAEVTIGQPVRAAFDLRPGAEAPRVVFRPRVLAEVAAAS
ncbi:OB-fold domain-containing protein [Frankia sp. AgB32]|uniref:Zn-ribbon domain-containing OB-fold protein n=1 Tax=Frankia sp. AgB32 TaxID=631119 RepID=UPI00200DEF83|nr:OB-fold domain-containing protein [Frankia sp. AgB32]MCK9893979.1 OB-fold domain-containing protein [Frankia sp. AgB32]